MRKLDLSDPAPELVDSSLLKKEMPEFGVLLQFARSRLTEPVGNSPALGFEDLSKAFEREFSTVEAASFDVFDTLLVRRVAHPMDVFLHLERQPAFTVHSFARPIAELRVEAERLARGRLFENQKTAEVVLPEIYEAFCELSQLPTTAINDLVSAEEAVELKLCRRNPRLQALFHRAAMAGKPLLAISDTYHRGDFLAQLLESIGSPLPRACIFASSECRVNKQSGQLFNHVFGQHQLAPSDLLHFGDHPISDHEMPSKLGVKALLHCHHNGGHSPAPIRAPESRLKSLFRAQVSFSARCADRASGFWWRLGHVVSLFGLVIWIGLAISWLFFHGVPAAGGK
jgi:FMN phosphatase YigB (HAD superfamily)